MWVYISSKQLLLHNKPKAEVRPGHKLMGPKEEEATVKKKHYWKCQFITTGNIQDLQRISVTQVTQRMVRCQWWIGKDVTGIRYGTSDSSVVKIFQNTLKENCQVAGPSRIGTICPSKFFHYRTRQVIRKHYEMKGKSFLKLKNRTHLWKNKKYIFPTCATATVCNLFALVISNKLQTTEWKHFSNDQVQFMYNYISLIITLNLCTTIFHYATV